MSVLRVVIAICFLTAGQVVGRLLQKHDDGIEPLDEAKLRLVTANKEEENRLRANLVAAVGVITIVSDRASEAVRLSIEKKKRREVAAHELQVADQRFTKAVETSDAAERVAATAIDRVVRAKTALDMAEQRRDEVVATNPQYAKVAADGASTEETRKVEKEEHDIEGNSTAFRRTKAVRVPPANLLLRTPDEIRYILDGLAETKREARQAVKELANKSQMAEDRKGRATEALVAAAQMFKAAQAMTDQTIISAKEAGEAVANARKAADHAQDKEMDELVRQVDLAAQNLKVAEEEKAKLVEAAKQAQMRKLAAEQVRSASAEKLKMVIQETEAAEASAQKAKVLRQEALANAETLKRRLGEAIEQNEHTTGRVEPGLQGGEQPNDAETNVTVDDLANVNKRERRRGMWLGGSCEKSANLAKIIDGPAQRNVQVLALENSGADLLNQLMRLNFGNQLNYYGSNAPNEKRNMYRGLDKKANIAALFRSETEVLTHLTDVHVVMLVRNPLSWLQLLRVSALESDPCGTGDDWLKKECVVGHPGGKYSSAPPIAYKSLGSIWNSWVGGYRKASTFGVTHNLLVPYEKLLRMPLEVLAEVGDFLGLGRPENGWTLLPPDSEKEQAEALHFVNDKLYLQKFTDAERMQACATIDEDLAKELGYHDCPA